MSKFDQIKDTDQLKDYLSKNSAGTRLQEQPSAASTSGYVGMTQLRSHRQVKTNVQTPSHNGGDRSERQPVKQKQDEDETRSLTAEIDYSKKDATRHLV